MSLSDDTYDHESYCEGFYDDYDRLPFIKKRSRLIRAVVQNEVETVKELLDSAEWYEVKDNSGLNLLQISILRESKAVFDYLLSLGDFPLDLENRIGDTALVVALSYFDNETCIEDHYAKELIKRGADINRIGFGNTPLTHYALERDFLEVVRLLIEHGIDIDAQNDDGKTALHMCFECTNSSYIVEAISMVLWYGADATIPDGNNSTAFDMVVFSKCDTWVQENLFYCIYDPNMRYKFSARVLLKLAELESPLFHQAVNIIGEIFYDDWVDDYSVTLLSIKTKYLQILMEKFFFVIKEIFTNYSSNLTFLGRFKPIYVENLDILLGSELKPEVLNYISEIDKNRFMEKLVTSEMSETYITDLVCFLLSYGMVIHEVDFQTIYRRFGYCKLFKILLHMDVEKQLVGSCLKDLMPRLICNVQTDIENIINNPIFYSEGQLQQLLHYCAHPKLTEFCRNINPHSEMLLGKTLENIPQVPLLVELARNVFRRHFIQTFHITSTKQFYTLLKLLPIGVNNKKILSFETKLY